MAYETIQAAIDYYINYNVKASRTSAAPPKLEISHFYMPADPNTKCWLRVIERSNTNTGRVFALRYSLVTNPKNTLGPITVEEFGTLSEELDMALSEFRRVNFKKISRQQRHIDGEEEYKGPRKSRHKI